MSWISNGSAGAYVTAMQKAVTDERIFSIFKQFPPIMRIVGVPCLNYAEQCYKRFKGTPEIMQNFETFLKNDTLGNPMKVGYRFGVDTLRFIESIFYLYSKFGDLSNKTIIELGSNYGGLAYCLLTQWGSIQKYHCIDLPEVQQLQAHYFNRLGFTHDAITYEQPTEQPWLAISEYCLTEFTDDELYENYERYFKNAQAIFIRSNVPEEGRERVFIKALQRDFTLEITPEPPTRGGSNKIIIGYK